MNILIFLLKYITACFVVYLFFGFSAWFVTLGEAGFDIETWGKSERAMFIAICLCFVPVGFLK